MKKLLNLLKESQNLDYRRLNIGEEDLDDTSMTSDEKRAFVEAVASYRKIGEAIYHNGNLMEAYENIKNIVETAEKLTLKETGDWFDKVTVNRHMKSMNESFKIFSSTIKEVATLQQRLESSYDEIGEVLGKYYEIKEGNEFGAERAKAIASGDDTFKVGGQSFKVTDVDAEDKKNAEEFVGENMSNMKLGSLLKNKKRVNEAKVIVYNEKTGERYEVLSGKGKGDLLIAMKALQSSAPSHMKYSIKENRRVNEELSAELPKATIPAAIQQRLALAIEKIQSGKLNFNQKIQLLAKVVDALGVDKTQLGTLTSKIKSKMGEALEGGLSSELPKATIPAAIQQRLTLALQKIESGKLNFNQKIQLLAKVVDALNVDKTQLGTLTSKIKSKMESYQAPEEEVTEGNEFGAERAKAIAAGNDTFTVDGKTYKVTDVDPADKKNAEEFTNESMRLTNLLKKKVVK